MLIVIFKIIFIHYKQLTHVYFQRGIGNEQKQEIEFILFFLVDA